MGYIKIKLDWKNTQKICFQKKCFECLSKFEQNKALLDLKK